MSPKRALGWVIFWISLALGFGALLWKLDGVEFRGMHIGGPEIAAEFITCYIIEWSLSVDNLFVFLMVFHSFGIQPKCQRKALWWGIMGAVVLRFVFILLGIGLVTMFESVLYIFGAILIYSGYKMLFKPEKEEDIRENRIVKFVQRFMPISHEQNCENFFVRTTAGLKATQLLLVVVVIEMFDVVFAIDSIPAAFAISRHPFVIFSANVFAIMGLRSLYFVLEHANKMFRFLRIGVAFILAFVGFKMIFAHFYKIPIVLSLSIVLGTLLLSILISLFIPEKNPGKNSK